MRRNIRIICWNADFRANKRKDKQWDRMIEVRKKIVEINRKFDVIALQECDAELNISGFS